MTQETIYGVISDIHQDPRVAYKAVNTLKELGAQKLLVNGDIGEWQGNIEATQQFSAIILDAVGKSGLESFVQPGSHERIELFQPVLTSLKEDYANIIDTTLDSKFEEEDHHLVFLPGSDFLGGGNYQLGSDDIKTGLYSDQGQYLHFKNMGDLRKEVTDPDRTVVVCHVPRKFENVSEAVDMAHFHQGRVYHRDPENMSQWIYTELSVLPGFFPRDKIEETYASQSFGLEHSDDYILQEALKIIQKEDAERWKVFVERNENRGNQDLAALYEELGITKAVSGHFHESGHRANDTEGKHVPEGQYVDELFWNSGHLDVGQTGLLFVKDGKVKYQNVRLQDYA